MASLTAASLAVPSFCGLRLVEPVSSKPCHAALPIAPIRSRPSASASLSDLASKASPAAAAVALVASTASLLLASSPALAASVTVGDEAGNFKFYPNAVTVAAGEPIEFKLSGETPHNIVFDIPSGAPAAVVKELQASSMGEYDVLTEDDATFVAKISTPGTYTFYCTPHKTSNMTGSVTVK